MDGTFMSAGMASPPEGAAPDQAFACVDRARHWTAQKWDVNRNQDHAERKHFDPKDRQKPEEAAGDQQESSRQTSPAQVRPA